LLDIALYLLLFLFHQRLAAWIFITFVPDYLTRSMLDYYLRSFSVSLDFSAEQIIAVFPRDDINLTLKKNGYRQDRLRRSLSMKS